MANKQINQEQLNKIALDKAYSKTAEPNQNASEKKAREAQAINRVNNILVKIINSNSVNEIGRLEVRALGLLRTYAPNASSLMNTIESTADAEEDDLKNRAVEGNSKANSKNGNLKDSQAGNINLYDLAIVAAVANNKQSTDIDEFNNPELPKKIAEFFKGSFKGLQEVGDKILNGNDELNIAAAAKKISSTINQQGVVESVQKNSPTNLTDVIVPKNTPKDLTPQALAKEANIKGQ